MKRWIHYFHTKMQCSTKVHHQNSKKAFFTLMSVLGIWDVHLVKSFFRIIAWEPSNTKLSIRRTTAASVSRSDCINVSTCSSCFYEHGKVRMRAFDCHTASCQFFCTTKLENKFLLLLLLAVGTRELEKSRQIFLSSPGIWKSNRVLTEEKEYLRSAIKEKKRNCELTLASFWSYTITLNVAKGRH